MIGRLRLVVTVALLAAAAVAAPASAHTDLISSSPKAGQVVPVPSKIVLTYAAEVILPKVVLTGPAKKKVAVGTVTVKENVVTVPLTAKLAPGPYTVSWRVVANDGHPVSDAYTFTVEGVQDMAIPPAADEPGGRAPWLWGGFGLAALTAITAGVLWARRTVE